MTRLQLTHLQRASLKHIAERYKTNRWFSGVPILIQAGVLRRLVANGLIDETIRVISPTRRRYFYRVTPAGRREARGNRKAGR